jgi:hypothetical protein
MLQYIRTMRVVSVGTGYSVCGLRNGKPLSQCGLWFNRAARASKNGVSGSDAHNNSRIEKK